MFPNDYFGILLVQKRKWIVRRLAHKKKETSTFYSPVGPRIPGVHSSAPTKTTSGLFLPSQKAASGVPPGTPIGGRLGPRMGLKCRSWTSKKNREASRSFALQTFSRTKNHTIVETLVAHAIKVSPSAKTSSGSVKKTQNCLHQNAASGRRGTSKDTRKNVEKASTHFFLKPPKKIRNLSDIAPCHKKTSLNAKTSNKLDKKYRTVCTKRASLPRGPLGRKIRDRKVHFADST